MTRTAVQVPDLGRRFRLNLSPQLRQSGRQVCADFLNSGLVFWVFQRSVRIESLMGFWQRDLIGHHDDADVSEDGSAP